MFMVVLLARTGRVHPRVHDCLSPRLDRVVKLWYMPKAICQTMFLLSRS